MIPLGILAQVGQIYTSWTRTTTPATVPYHSITYAPLTAGNWFMFGAGSGGTQTTSYYYSTNGTSWTTGTLPQSRTFGVSASNGTILLAHPVTGNSGDYFTTTNGTTWTQRTIETSSADHYILKFLNGRFFRLASSASSSFFVGTDGINWTSVSVPQLRDIDFGNGVLMAVSGSSSVRICSGDPLVAGNWVSVTLPTIANGTPSTIAFNNGIWVVGYGGTTTSYAYSLNNGSSWLTGTLPASLGTYNNGSGGGFNGAANTRLRSADGAIYYSINNSVHYSTDGINWSSVSTGTGLTFNSRDLATNGLGQAIMVGNGGTNNTNTATYLRGA
jgi:hypothetical protein